MSSLWIVPLVVVLGIAGFVGFWIGIIRLIAAFGWSKLAQRHTAPFDPPPTAQLYSAQSLWTRNTNYRGSMNIWIDAAGIFLRPMLIFRMFHPMLLIRWNHIRSVSERGSFLTKHVQVDLGDDLPALNVHGRSGAALLNEWRGRSR